MVMASLDSFDPVVQINAQKFTDSERDLILEVVARDEYIRRQEKTRIDHLKEELKNLREKGVPEGQDEAYGRVCKRCRTPLGLVFNSGALCPNCEKKVCKNCRVNVTHKDEADKSLPQWLCTYCAKIRDIKAESGAWFYDSKVHVEKKRKVYGSLLIKRLFTSRVKKIDNLIFKDPNWEDIIEERDEDIEDIDDAESGYVLVTPNSSGDFTVKEGNISQLLSSKAVVGLQGAHLMRKSEYDLLLQDHQPETIHEAINNNASNESSEAPLKTLAQLAHHDHIEKQSSSSDNDDGDKKYPQDLESDDERQDFNSITVDTQLHNDANSTDQFIEKLRTVSSSSSSSSDDEQTKELLNGQNDLELGEKVIEENSNEIIDDKKDEMPHSEYDDTVNDELREESEEIDKEDQFANVSGLQTKKKKDFESEEDLDSYFTEYKLKKEQSGSVESLGSNYSNEGDINEVISAAGEVFVGFRYDHNETRFEVQIHRAKDLPAADPKKNTTDPYVKVYLDPEPSRKGGKRKTKVKKHALNPEFDEVLEFNNIDYDEVTARSCLISVWHNGLKHIKLGEVSVNLGEFIQSGFSLLDPSPQWYTLSEKTVRKEQVKFVGDLVIRLHFKTPSSQLANNKKQQSKLPNPTKGELDVHVVSARSLGRDGEINPFCKVELFSKNITSVPKMKTSFIKDSKDPWWNEMFTIPNVSWSDLENAAMQFSIWHYQKGKNHQLVGGVRIGLGKTQNGIAHDSFGEEVKAWKNFMDHPNELLEYSLPIRSTLESVKNEVIPPTESVKIISDDDHYKIKASKKESSGSQTSLFAKKFLNADTVSLASSGSMLSIYSDAGGQRNDLIITGEILFSMKHDIDSGIFSVTVEKAKGIAAVNAKAQTSDPYVKIYLLPDKNKDSKKKTLHRRKTVNPEWNETVKYKISRDDLLKRTLQLAIWNHDRFGRNDFLGEVQINMKHYSRSNDLSKAIPVWYTLQEEAPISIGDSTEKKGELKLCLKYVNDTLTVLVKEASNLTAADENKLSNPFVKCYLLPDKSRKSKRKTSVQKKTVNPVWNDKFEYTKVSEFDLQLRVLEITVWDYDSSGHQFLGGLRCGSAQGDEYWHDCYDKEVTIWEAMIKHAGIFAEYDIPLRPTMVSRKGQNNEVTPQAIPMITEELEKERIASQEQTVLPPGTPQVRVAVQYIDHTASEYDDVSKKKKNSSQLMLHLKEARNLPFRQSGETPSSIAKFYLLPKKKNKLKTDVYLKSTEPQWDAEFAVAKDISIDELKERALEIVICDIDDESKGKERELGYVRLGSGFNIEHWDDSKDGEVDIWKSMLTQHNRWITKVLPLRPCETLSSDSFKKKKDKGSKKSKKSTDEESEVHDDEFMSNEMGNDGSESPRTSALRAMGSHASTVIEMMQSHDSEPPYMRPQEGLSPIEEDENETESPPKFQSIPSITVSQDVQPGEPPFPGAGYNADVPKTLKAKEPPVVSLLKRTPSMGSLTSVYSTDSANIYDQVPIRGDIQFGMRYVHKKNIFEVHVFQARDIAAVDSKKVISDPYCKIYLLPDKTKGGKKKTKTRKKTLNPEWEEILEFSISIRDLRTRTLWLSVWHQERLGRNIFLGEVMLNMDSLVDEGSQLETPTPKWYTLCEKGNPPMVDLYKGFLKISLMFEDEDLMRRGGKNMDFDDDSSSKKKKKKKKKDKQEGKGKIRLHLKEANDLPAADKDGLSDPFCKCYLLPLKPAKSKRKTPVIKHTRDPIWDYQTEYMVDYEDLPDLGLELTIWDWDRGVKNDFLGCTRLNLGARTGNWDDAEGEELLAWQHLIDNPNKWKDFTIPLRSKLDFRSAKR